MLHDDGPVQVLAALGGDVHAHGAEYTVQPRENGVRHLRRGPAAHLLSHHLAGAASHHHDLAPMQMGGLRQLLCRRRGLLPHLRQQAAILYFMHDTCHSISFLSVRSCGRAKAPPQPFLSPYIVYHCTASLSRALLPFSSAISTSAMTSPTAPWPTLASTPAAAPMPSCRASAS